MVIRILDTVEKEAIPPEHYPRQAERCMFVLVELEVVQQVAVQLVDTMEEETVMHRLRQSQATAVVEQPTLPQFLVH